MHKLKLDGRVYIGQTCMSLKQRSGRNGHRYKNCPKFYNAIQKYGWNNFEHIILETKLTQQEANRKEQYWIKIFNSIQNGYNIQAGGHNNMAGQNNPFYGKTHTEESKKKMSLNHKDVSGKNNPMYGKHHSDEAKEKIQYTIEDLVYNRIHALDVNIFSKQAGGKDIQDGSPIQKTRELVSAWYVTLRNISLLVVFIAIIVISRIITNTIAPKGIKFKNHIHFGTPQISNKQISL